MSKLAAETGSKEYVYVPIASRILLRRFLSFFVKLGDA